MSGAAYADWLGVNRRDTLNLDPRPARLMQATLSQPVDLDAGDALPPLWHWLYVPDETATDALGPDGHTARGGFLPPVPLPRRMWAGGRFGFKRPLRLGGQVTRGSEIIAITEKSGRAGKLCFVTVRHDFVDKAGALFWEEHDIVYRELPDPDAPPTSAPAPPDGATVRETITPSLPLLFRYSALTFNTHRIHYDLDYCRDMEGYPGCIVHGPLIATLLMGLAVRQLGQTPDTFSFRATAPLFHDRPFSICAKQGTNGLLLWAETPDGGLAMRAEAG